MSQFELDNTAKRGDKARVNLVNALRECGEVADAVSTFEGRELFDTLDYLDSLRSTTAEFSQRLSCAVRGSHG